MTVTINFTLAGTENMPAPPTNGRGGDQK
jgi:hypothetical protein